MERQKSAANANKARALGNASEKLTDTKIAGALGISVRTLYRLRKKGGPTIAKQDVELQRFRISLLLLTELGHSDLLGSNAQSYIEFFISAFVHSVCNEIREDASAIDPRWAAANAQAAADIMRAAIRRRQNYLDAIIETENNVIAR